MSNGFESRTLKRKNVKGLALSAPPPRGSNPSEGDSQIPGAIGNTDSNRTDTLEIGLEFKLDLRSEDLVVLKELGAGNGGTVSKVMHAGTKVVMARKIIRVDAKENVRKQILRELQVGHDCSSPYVITFYGAFQNDARDIVLCMEYMDCGSLDRISKDFGPVRVDVLGKITESILGGLVYLYEAHRIMHRDIKPSNVLVNSRGNIKLCDFGVATESLVNSVANTFVGTSTYMAPERIQGGAYSIKSDVWSVGLTIMELAIGRFPFDASDAAAGDRASAGPMGILDLLQTIVHEPAPKLPKSEAFPAILDDFIAKCLLKSPEERPTPRELYDKDNFLQAAKRTPVDLQQWAVSMMERHNRKSYLAPPAPKALKRDGSRDSVVPFASNSISSGQPTPDSRSTSSSFKHPPLTPTSGEIPIIASAEPALPLFHHSPLRQPAIQTIPTLNIPTGIAERTPQPPLSLQHLSLETSDSPAPNGYAHHSNFANRSNRLLPHQSRLDTSSTSRDNIPEPMSAIEPSTRPMFPPRTSSSTSGTGLQAARLGQASSFAGSAMTLPIRPPPPTGPLPPPPSQREGISAGAGIASPRRQR